MFCHKCGAQLSEGSAFCSRCGTQVAAVSTETPMNVSPKSRLAMSLLAWFLGSLGAHRFYAGKIRTAIVMLLITIIAYAIMIGAFIAMFGVIWDEYWWAPFFLSMVISWVLHMSVWVWSIIDFIVAVTGNFTDSEGMVIKKW